MNNWLKNVVLVFGVLIPVFFAYKQHLDIQRQSLEFEKYKTITRALEQLSTDSTTVHQQAFFIHELKNHPDYYDVSLRILNDVLSKEKNKSVFTDEIELTIKHIKNEIQQTH